MNTETTGQVPEWSIEDRLRKARDLTGLDQDEFAELIGVSRGTVSSYERGSPGDADQLGEIILVKTGQRTRFA